MRSYMTKLHKQLWVVFSEYIRLRDCLETTGTKERGACITCKRIYDFPALQAGHFVSRAHYSIRYDERNVHAQCMGCNMFKKGAIDEYFIALEQKYGRPVVDEILGLKHSTRRFKQYELEQLIDHYKQKIKELRG